MEHERIVATAIYYFDSHNNQDDKLLFRRAAHLVRDSIYLSGLLLLIQTHVLIQASARLAQNDARGVEVMFGIHLGEPMIED